MKARLKDSKGKNKITQAYREMEIAGRISFNPYPLLAFEG